MAFRNKTIGINFPFVDSNKGDFLYLTEYPEAEIKSNLIHLLLTKKGSRYFLPDFGTNLHQFIFDPLDDTTISKIENEIIDSCEKYLNNIKINKINVTQFGNDLALAKVDSLQHQVSLDIDYTITSRSFQTTDSVTLIF